MPKGFNFISPDETEELIIPEGMEITDLSNGLDERVRKLANSKGRQSGSGQRVRPGDAIVRSNTPEDWRIQSRKFAPTYATNADDTAAQAKAKALAAESRSVGDAFEHAREVEDNGGCAAVIVRNGHLRGDRNVYVTDTRGIVLPTAETTQHFSPKRRRETSDDAYITVYAHHHHNPGDDKRHYLFTHTVEVTRVDSFAKELCLNGAFMVSTKDENDKRIVLMTRAECIAELDELPIDEPTKSRDRQKIKRSGVSDANGRWMKVREKHYATGGQRHQHTQNWGDSLSAGYRRR
jgi:hypothetical protein